VETFSKVKVSKVYFLAGKQIQSFGVQHTEQCLHVKAKASPSHHPYIPENPGNHAG